MRLVAILEVPGSGSVADRDKCDIVIGIGIGRIADALPLTPPSLAVDIEMYDRGLRRPLRSYGELGVHEPI